MQQEVDPAPDPAVSPRRPFQYSLSTLMLLTTIVALLFAMFAMYRELKQARADRQTAVEEVKKYRREMGYLEVADPKKMCARGLRIATNSHWSWRVYLPNRGRFWLCTCTRSVPEEGIPPADSRSLIEAYQPREKFIDASVEEGADKRWRLHLDGSSSTIPPLEASSSEGVTPEQQETVEPGQPLVLLRMRKLKRTPTAYGFHTGPIAGPTDGVMIWIEEDKPAPAGPAVPPTPTPSPPAAAGGK